MNIPNQILMLTSYPPRACGIATYSQDLLHVLNKGFSNSFDIKVCALENDNMKRKYPEEIINILDTRSPSNFTHLAEKINNDTKIKAVFIQHEFGLYGGDYGENLLYFLFSTNKPIIITFPTVLPNPEPKRKSVIQTISNMVEKITVMTNDSSKILQEEYEIPKEKISVIPHGTHPITCESKLKIKENYALENRLMLSTFGLINANKSIETALNAMPEIVQQFPNVLYLIIGQTHPCVLQNEGEQYRNFLEQKVKQLRLENNVCFINRYLNNKELLEYLTMTDIYLFTSKDPHQAVSGTFSYAMSSACPIISTAIPHAKEMLTDDTGIIIDFENSAQLAKATIRLLLDQSLREQMGQNAFHKTRATLWENVAIAYAHILNDIVDAEKLLEFNLPSISLSHINEMTTDFGIIQFSKLGTPDIGSGFTLDDNARALVAVCMHYKYSKSKGSLSLLSRYLHFIENCQLNDGSFINYINNDGRFHSLNEKVNLDDSNGRAIWALGKMLYNKNHFTQDYIQRAEYCLVKALQHISTIQSPRAQAFIIKGLWYYNQIKNDIQIDEAILKHVSKLIDNYNMYSDDNWQWFEEYMTYANSILPEAILYGYLITGSIAHKKIAKQSFDFLLKTIFEDNKIKAISNKGWLHKNKQSNRYGEQPIDVAYTIMTLKRFYDIFAENDYLEKMNRAFSWFLGNNHLKQTIYNPASGGCFDGLEKENVNLNQGAESTICYLIARMTMEKYIEKKQEQFSTKELILNVKML